MSPLTKIFVALHVILSVMLTAGLVVFVNRMENFQQTNASLKAMNTVQTARAETADANAAAVRASAERDRNAAMATIETIRGTVNALQGQISDRDVRLAENASTLAQLASASTKTAQALAASEDQKAKQGEQIVALRSTVDDLTKKNSEQSVAISDLTNKLEVSGRELKFSNEQLVESKEQGDRLSKQLRELGVTAENAPAIGTRASAPPINAVVRGVKQIEGVTYATISVGSAENVIKGMVFNVIDRSKGEFLGVMTIDQVDSHEATGRLDGPKIAQVQVGAEAKTQL